MKKWSISIIRYSKFKMIKEILIRLIGSSIVIIPTSISLMMVIISQFIRELFNYPKYPVLFIIPVIVLVLLVIVSAVTKSYILSGNSKQKISNSIGKLPIYFISSLITLLISARFVGIVWGSKYLSPLYEAQYISGHAHIDTLFHSAMANMLVFFGRPSIGVEGVVTFPYHFGSHLLIATVSRLLHLSVLQTYHLVYPTLILPLWFGSFLLLNEVILRKWFLVIERRWLVLVASLVFFLSISGIMPETFRDSVGAWNNIIISESYAVSIMFLYLFTALIIHYFPKRSGFSNPLGAFIFYALVLFSACGLTLLKLSVGTLWCVGLAFLWISDPRNSKKLFAVILAGIGFIGVFPFVHSSTGVARNLYIGHFILNYVDIENISFYLIVNYGWTFLALLMIQVQILKNMISLPTGRAMQYILGSVLIVGALPGLLLPIGGGSASYFISVNVWVSLPMIAVLISSLFSAEKAFALILSNILTTTFTLLLLFSPIVTPIFNTLRSLAVFQKRTETYVKSIDKSSQDLWNVLSKLDQDKKQLQVLEYDQVPPYGTRGLDNKRTWMATYMSAAAISGIPTINKVEETNELLRKVLIGYGFDGLLFNREQNNLPSDISTIHILHRNGDLIYSQE
jgi:hypothetical protein